MQTAKNTQPSIADRERANYAKAEKAAKKKFEDASDFTTIAANACDGVKRGESATAVLSFYMEEHYGADWYTWTSANARSDNEKAHFASIEERRKEVQEMARTKGLRNTNKPWSDAKAHSRKRHTEGNTPTQKPLDKKQLEGLKKLYRAGMREERPTDRECDVNEEIGRMLVAYFNVDLSTFD